MKYLCHDIFMVRVPSLPLKIFESFNNKANGNISDYISKNEDIMNFMKESVLLSSKSLYNSLNNPPTEKKKIKNYNLGLLKYFTRASTRPTPYGLFSGVGLGSFSDKTKIIIDENKFQRDIKADTYWICHVIHNLENDIKIASQLKLKFNPICFVSGDRVKNPYFSNHGDIDKHSDYVKENSIIIKLKTAS